MYKIFFFLGWFLLAHVNSFLEAQNSKKKVAIAVLDFQAQGNIEQTDAAALTVHMRKQLAKRNNIYLFSPEEMDEQFAKNNIEPADPSNIDFVLQAGRILNADFIITGQIFGVNNKYTVEIRMFSVFSGNVVDSYKKDYAGDISGLAEIINRIASGLSQNIRFKKSKTVEIVPHYWFIGLEGGFPLAGKRTWDGRFSLMATWERNLSKNFIVGIRAGYIEYTRSVYETEKPKLIQYPILLQLSYIFPKRIFSVYPGFRFIAGMSLEKMSKIPFTHGRKTEDMYAFSLLFRKDFHKHCYLQLSGDIISSSSDLWGPYGATTAAVYVGIGYRIGK